MKQTTLKLLLLFVLCVGCSKSDDEENDDIEPIEDIEIILHPQSGQEEIGICQNIAVTSTCKKREGQKLSWSFRGGKSDNGFTIEGDTLYMFPQQLGEYAVALHIDRDGKRKNVVKNFTVVPCDYGFAFFGATANEILLNEESYSMMTYNKLSTPEFDNMGTEIVFEDEKYPYTSHRYYLNKKGHLCRGLDKSVVRYAESRYEEIEELFKHFVSLVNARHGVKTPDEIHIMKGIASPQETEFKDYALRIGDFYQGYWYKANWTFKNTKVLCYAMSLYTGRIDYYITYESIKDESEW